MNSSGIKRGLATTAVSALAVAGLPFLASSASATPIEDTFGDPNAIDMYVPEGAAGISAKNDGTNTTVSLVTGGGANVTSVLYQYSVDGGTTWVNVPGGNVARNADGVFAYDWSNPPANVTHVRAVPNTGVAFADTESAATIPDATADTMELATEGNLGVFQAPYATETVTGDYVAVTGTVSDGTANVTVWDASHGTAGNTAMNVDADSDTFEGVVDIEGYPYSPGAEPNQIALAGFTQPDITNDAEGSTLYVQTIGSITATPETQEDATPADAEVTLTVLDTQGQPVANAQVFSGGDSDTDGAGPDTDADGAETLVGYTDGNGQITDVPGGAGTETYYVNTTDNDAYQPGTDPSDTATVTTYTPALTTVDIVNDRNRSTFDLDEFLDSDDFTIVTKDQRGNAMNEDLVGADVEYRWVVDPSAAGDTVTSPWIPAETAANGEFQVPGPTDADIAVWTLGTVTELPEGSYTIEARRPNVGGVGLTNAAPETVTASESEITFDEGASASAPVNGQTTINGNLANDTGGLGGREIQITYTPTGDSALAPTAQQPTGVTVTGNTATAVTDANGDFAIVLTDPDVPDNVTPTPETGTLNAIAEEAANDTTSLQGNNGPNDSTAANDPNNAEQEITVNWAEAPEVVAIDVDTQILDDYSYYGGTAAPGSPVDLDITVLTNDGGDPGTALDPVQDATVTVEVNKGFLSPNAEDEDDLQLDDTDTSGLWGFFEDLGQSEDVSTGDSAVAGIVAAIEQDADFDDNGLTEMVITVTSGGVTEEVDVTFDARNFLQLVEGDLNPAEGEPSGEVQVGNEVDFSLFTEDQYGNLVGDHQARISDDSTVADFRTDEDFDFTLTDFTTSGTGITAFSEAPTTQTLMAQLGNQEVLVDDADGDDSPEVSNTQMALESDPIVWVAAPPPEKIAASLELKGEDNGKKDDNLLANAHRKTRGATVILFRKENGEWNRIAKGTMNRSGNFRFDDINDRNGNKITRYKAKVKPTERTLKGVEREQVR